MIPLRDVVPSRTTPVVTITLIVVNVLVFLFQVSLGPGNEPFVHAFGLVPADFSWVAVLTSMFLHGGFLHVAGNMLYLWIFGDNVEDRMGHDRFLLFYLLCGALAALAQAWVNPASAVPMVGASGAIAGVMGAYFVLYPHSRIVTFVPPFFMFEIPALFFLGLWFLLEFVSGSLAPIADTATGGIAVWAHVAGFIAGLAGVFVFRRRERLRVEWWNDV